MQISEFFYSSLSMQLTVINMVMIGGNESDLGYLCN